MFVPMRRFLASAPHRRWLSTNPWTRPVGEGALLLRFGTGIDDAVSRRVLAYKARLEAAPPLAGVPVPRARPPARRRRRTAFDPRHRAMP